MARLEYSITSYFGVDSSGELKMINSLFTLKTPEEFFLKTGASWSLVLCPVRFFECIREYGEEGGYTVDFCGGLFCDRFA